MIQAVLFVNQKGEVVISRTYRDGFSRSMADTFRSQVLGSKEVRARAPAVACSRAYGHARARAGGADAR